MKKVFMVHGYKGEPNGGWRPWLMGQLYHHDIWAFALDMPTPEMPIKDEWVRKISEEVKNPNEDVFLIGHSLGVPAILRYLETLPKDLKIGGAILVSGPVYKIKKEKYEYVNIFLERPFDFDHIKKACNQFVVIHGDNDKNVPFSDAKYLADKLSCDLVSVPNGGHLNGSAGWYELPQALNAILKMTKINNS